MNTHLVGVTPINYKIKHASVKMFSLPYGSRSRVRPDRPLQSRSDTAGRSCGNGQRRPDFLSPEARHSRSAQQAHPASDISHSVSVSPLKKASNVLKHLINLVI